MTPEQLSEAVGCLLATATKWAAPITSAMERFEINTPVRQAMFLAQIGHESAGLSRVVESTYYTRADRLLAVFPHDFANVEDAAKYVKRPEACANRIYARQNGNGPEASGDGWQYRGRGLIQITGRSNYAQCSIGLYGHPSRLLTEPELLEQPDDGSQSAGWYWYSHGCNPLADAGDIRAVTRRINGGWNGLADRMLRYERAEKALGII